MKTPKTATRSTISWDIFMMLVGVFHIKVVPAFPSDGHVSGGCEKERAWEQCQSCYCWCHHAGCIMKHETRLLRYISSLSLQLSSRVALKSVRSDRLSSVAHNRIEWSVIRWFDWKRGGLFVFKWWRTENTKHLLNKCQRLWSRIKSSCGSCCCNRKCGAEASATSTAWDGLRDKWPYPVKWNNIK